METPATLLKLYWYILLCKKNHHGVGQEKSISALDKHFILRWKCSRRACLTELLASKKMKDICTMRRNTSWKWPRFGYLQVREHAQQAPQETAVDGLSAPLLLDEQQDPIDGFTLDLLVADDVEPEQLETHVPAEHNTLSTCFKLEPFVPLLGLIVRSPTR